MSVTETAESLREVAERSNAWPFEEARKIVARLKKQPKEEVIFETGYGPSGLPHIGTFGEVARTTMVRHAFRVLTDDKIKTRLIAFSDDMDGLRKVPDNVPNKEMLEKHLGKPLTKVPDPFGTHPSFGEHNNARLRAFLDHFGFEYEFLSSTQCYTSGRFDGALLKVLERFDKVMAIMLPSLREERAADLFAVPADRSEDRRRAAGAGALARCQGRHHHLRRPRHEAAGHRAGHRRPLQAAVEAGLGHALGGARRRLRNGRQGPDQFGQAVGRNLPRPWRHAAGRLQLRALSRRKRAEDFQVQGQRADHRRMAALCISPESLSLFMYREPKAAKRLYFDVIPRTVDEYQQFLDGYQRQDARQQLSNPVWHIHSGHPPKVEMPVTFSMLLTLVSSSNAENAETLWGFIGRYRPGVTPQSHPKLNAQVEYAIHYFRDFVQPAKKFREPTDVERAALTDLRDALSNLTPQASAEEIQDVVYEVGRREPFLDQKKKAKDGKPGVSLDWFNMLYQVLLGQEKGPRFGSFVAVYGLQNTVDMIDGALARSA